MSGPKKKKPRLEGCRAAGLPGSFSVRGDWFLGVARGSRSYKMGERAIDLLTTRRGNIVRLQEGIGLPVRGCGNPEAAELWTPIPWVDEAGSSQDGRTVTYQQLRRLGARCDNDTEGRCDFWWLWRSRIQGYERDARLWRRWLCSMFLERPDELKKTDGFEMYDMADGLRKTTRRYETTRKWFKERCEEFRRGLNRAATAIPKRTEPDE